MPFPLFFLWSCDLDPLREGTAVGNPTGLAVATGAPKDITLLTGSAVVDSVALTGCDGSTGEVPVGERLDLLAGTVIDLPAGEWCGLELSFATVLSFRGATNGGEDVAIDLAVPRIVLAGTAPLPDPAVVAELGAPGWVAVADLAGATVVEPGSVVHDVLVARIVSASAVFNDRDEDGSVDDDEREEGSVAEGDDDDETDDSETDDSGTDDSGTDDGGTDDSETDDSDDSE